MITVVVHEILALVWFVFVELVHLAPWFLVAIVLGIAVQRLSIDVVARRSFRRRGVLGILIVTAVGAFSPFCSFTVVPLIRKFLAAGVPLSVVMSFWVASPSMDPEIFALSATQLGVPVATARLVGALVLSLGAGFLVLAFERRGHFRAPLRASAAPRAKAGPDGGCASSASSETPACGAGTAGDDAQDRPADPPCGSSAGAAGDPVPALATVAPGPGGAAVVAAGAVAVAVADERTAGEASADGAPTDGDDDGTPWRVLVRRDLRRLDLLDLLKEIVSDSRILGKYLVLAVAAEAVIVRYVPETVVNSVLGVEGLTSVLVAALVGVPLYLNGVGAIPLVDGLMHQGMLPAAAVTFLLAGAVTTVPAMVAVRSVVTGRVFGVYLGVSMIGSLLIGAVLIPLI